MIEAVFRTDDFPTADRAEAWRDQLSRMHAPLEVIGHPPADYYAHQRVLNLGNALVWPSVSEPLDLRRTPRLIRQLDPDMYHLSLIVSGTVGFTMSGQDALYGAYDVRTNDSSRPCEIRLGTRREPVKAIGIDLPKALLPLPVAQADRVIGHRMTARNGPGALVASFLATLTENASSYTAADAPRLERVLVDLLAVLFAHELDALGSLPSETCRRALTLRIRAFIRQHLHNPELTPPMIADAHHISVSHLHRLFKSSQDSVAAYIRRLRLEHIRRDLADPTMRSVPIYRIADRWGFTHHAVFTRAFRAAYGISPRDFRHSVTDH